MNHGALVIKPGDPTRECYTFEGLLLNGVAYDFDDEVVGDLTLIADWVEAVVGPTPLTEDVALQNVDVTGTNTRKQTSEHFEISHYIGTDSNFRADQQWRVYTANYVTIEALNGETIKQIEITTGSEAYANAAIGGWVNTVKDGTPTQFGTDTNDKNIAASTTGSVATFTLSTPTTFVKIKPNAQTRWNSIKISFFETVMPDLASVTISSASGSSVQEKASLQLNALVKDVDDETVKNATLTWESLSEEVATVDSKGLVTTDLPGTAIIKVTAARRASIVFDQFAITVNARPAEAPTKIVFQGYEDVENPTLTGYLADGTIDLKAIVLNQYDEEMTGVDLVWESSDTAVATVNNSLITLASTGLTTIKVYLADDSDIYAELVLTVEGGAAIVHKTATITVSNGTTGTKEIDGISFTAVSTKNQDGGLQLDKSGAQSTTPLLLEKLLALRLLIVLADQVAEPLKFTVQTLYLLVIAQEQNFLLR